MDLSIDSYRKIIETIPDGLYIVDANKRVAYWNHAAERISGFTAAEVLGQNCSDNLLCHVDEGGTTLCHQNCPFTDAAHNGHFKGEVFLRHKDGHRVPVSIHVTTLHDDQGRVSGEVMIFNDISSKATIDLRLKELETLALLDKLTHLANRHYLERELESHLEELSRYGVAFGVIFMDIDNFKAVNDTYGHDVGDRVLQFVARTLQANSRPFDLYGRWGGEEFVGLARSVEMTDLKQIGQRLRRLVEKSFLMVEGQRLHVTISLGATLACEKDTLASLMQRADMLMYRSKREGRNRLTLG
jgi:diguanylate cyclase (GGDEF)-like protein/PAS domain S-box-containing protein